MVAEIVDDGLNDEVGNEEQGGCGHKNDTVHRKNAALQ